jgi:hypothetical protein
LPNRFGISIWHFDSAKRIQFDDPAIRFGNSIWQNEFNLPIWQLDLQFDLAKRIQFQLDISIWQFDLAFQFGKTNSI